MYACSVYRLAVHAYSFEVCGFLDHAKLLSRQGRAYTCIWAGNIWQLCKPASIYLPVAWVISRFPGYAIGTLLPYLDSVQGYQLHVSAKTHTAMVFVYIKNIAPAMQRSGNSNKWCSVLTPRTWLHGEICTVIHRGITLLVCQNEADCVTWSMLPWRNNFTELHNNILRWLSSS